MSDAGVVLSPRSGARWLATIGLEVHVQLATRTKLFCACACEFAAPPNARTCAVCTGQPGALPVPNAEALALAARVGLALGCRVAPTSEFARKNYFYCDLPKGYQITQYEQPLCEGGGLTLASGKRVRLKRIHVEEDAGKAIHDRGEGTLVDLNRAGVPLIEIVSEPDLANAREAVEYLAGLREIVQWIGASSCDMEKGELRCDVNVSVRPEGEHSLRTKVEIKNLNSFRFVQQATEHEIARQVEAWEERDPALHPRQETRLFDTARGLTRTMRVKESEDDYRYFPDPDLPPIVLEPAFLERQRGFLPELPAARRARWVASLGLSEYDAGVLGASRLVADYFEAVLRAGGRPKESANWLANEVLGLLGDAELARPTLDELELRPHALAELVELVASGRVSHAAGKKLLRAMVESGKRAGELARELGLEQVRDLAAIEGFCRQALAAKPQVAEQVRGGNEKALGALIGPALAASQGRADPQLVRETLLRLIAEG